MLALQIACNMTVGACSSIQKIHVPQPLTLDDMATPFAELSTFERPEKDVSLFVWKSLHPDSAQRATGADDTTITAYLATTYIAHIRRHPTSPRRRVLLSTVTYEYDMVKAYDTHIRCQTRAHQGVRPQPYLVVIPIVLLDGQITTTRRYKDQFCSGAAKLSRCDAPILHVMSRPVPRYCSPRRFVLRSPSETSTLTSRIAFTSQSNLVPGSTPLFASSLRLGHLLGINLMATAWTLQATNDGFHPCQSDCCSSTLHGLCHRTHATYITIK